MGLGVCREPARKGWGENESGAGIEAEEHREKGPLADRMSSLLLGGENVVGSSPQGLD